MVLDISGGWLEPSNGLQSTWMRPDVRKEITRRVKGTWCVQYTRNSLCGTARYTVVWFFNFLCNQHCSPSYIFYATHSSQITQRKRKESPNSIRPHLLSSVAWISCVRTSRLKSYVPMVMPANSSTFCCTLQGICRRRTLNSPKLIRLLLVQGSKHSLWFIWIMQAYYRLHSDSSNRSHIHSNHF